jgi:hypothetical protein
VPRTQPRARGLVAPTAGSARGSLSPATLRGVLPAALPAAIVASLIASLAGSLASCAALGGRGGPSVVADWILPSLLESEEGSAVSIRGTPSVVQTTIGPAVAFDGSTDAIVLDHNPLAGIDRFTVEVVMRPAADGPAEQRYLHFGEVDGDRVMLETRVTPDGRWYHDAYVHSRGSGLALIDPVLLHPADEWFHVALVFDRGWFAVYLDGLHELEGSVEFVPITGGRTSIGVRQNEVSWFRGEIHRIRITDRPLRPDQFLPAPRRSRG